MRNAGSPSATPAWGGEEVVLEGGVSFGEEKEEAIG